MARANWLWLGLLLVIGCAPPAAPTDAIEQAGPDGPPALELKSHLTHLGALRLHQDAIRGQKVTVAVLDSGFRDYQKYLGRGLPARVKTRSFRANRNLEARDSQHGILCAEVIHAIAPDADILFANWEPDSPRSFLNAVRWARSEGAKIISCSLIMPSWSDGEGGGEVHRELDPLLNDVLFFASAGNTAQRHWCGYFAPNDDGWHTWRGDGIDNTLKPWGSERVAVELYGPTERAFELTVWNAASKQLVGRSVLEVDATRRAGRAVVRFEPDADALYEVRVRCVETPRTSKEAFHLVVLGGTLETTTPRGSIPFPGDGANVFAVGAVDAENQRVHYSSCGPNSPRPKPDYVAVVPFPSLCRSKPFAGTSAAAPQAAGLAALLWSRESHWSAADVTRAMRAAAVDLGPRGHDPETGYGLIRAMK